MDAGVKLGILQKNLEEVVAQLGEREREASAAQADATASRDLVNQLTKKLDVVSRRNKALEKEQARAAAAREGAVHACAQTDEDARLLAARQTNEELAQELAKAEVAAERRLCAARTEAERCEKDAREAAMAREAEMEESLALARTEAAAAVARLEINSKQAAHVIDARDAEASAPLVRVSNCCTPAVHASNCCYPDPPSSTRLRLLLSVDSPWRVVSGGRASR